MKVYQLFRLLFIITLCLLLCCTAACTTTPDDSAAASAAEDPWGLDPIEPEDYYGRNQLRGKELKAYVKMAEGVESFSESINLSGCKLSVDQFKKVLFYYRADYPQHFWLDAEYVVQTAKETVVSYKPKYTMHPIFVDIAKSKLEEKVGSVLPLIAECKTDYEKEKYIHDYLSNNVDYTLEGDHVYTAYGALVQKKAVCEGYSKAFQHLCYRAGIECLYVTGESVNPMVTDSDPIPHSWNIVKIDGKYYNVDSTWDDQPPHIFYSYFNVPDKMIKKDHTFSDDNYPLPKCNSKDAWYFTLNDCILEEYTVANVADRIMKNDNYARVYVADDPDKFLKWYQNNIEDIVAQLGTGNWYVYSYGQLGNEFVLSIGDGTVE